MPHKNDNLLLTFPSAADLEQEAQQSLHVDTLTTVKKPCLDLVCLFHWFCLNSPTDHHSDWQSSWGNVEKLLGSVIC